MRSQPKARLVHQNFHSSAGCGPRFLVHLSLRVGSHYLITSHLLLWNVQVVSANELSRTGKADYTLLVVLASSVSSEAGAGPHFLCFDA